MSRLRPYHNEFVLSVAQSEVQFLWTQTVGEGRRERSLGVWKGNAMAEDKRWSRATWDWVLYVVISWGLVLGIACVGCAWITGLIPPPQTYHLTIIGQNCGTVYLGSPQPYDADNGEQCLWDAYVSCRTATLEVAAEGVDAGWDEGITIQRQRKNCVVSETVIAWGGGKLFAQSAERFSTYQCAGLQTQKSGLVVKGCGHSGGEFGERSEDDFIPARPANQIGHVCGIIGNSYPMSLDLRSNTEPGLLDAATIENCFWQAYTTCQQPATLLFEQQAPVTGTDTPTGSSDQPPSNITLNHTLVAQRVNGACSLTDDVTSYAGAALTLTTAAYTCANLRRGPDGALTAHRCGAERDVVIPAPPPATPTQ